MMVLLTAGACSPAAEHASVSVHYLGHAAFLLTFEDTLTVLTDYGASRAWGLDSPVYDFGAIRPDIVTRSHEHLDHAGGELPEGMGPLLTGDEPFEAAALTITPIPTYERSLESPDNVSFVFDYRGLKVLHLGDCQGLMLGLDEPGMRDRVQQLYPDTYDLVLLPIGYVSDILAEAAQFVTLLDARRVVPMHYWSPADRDTFLGLLDGRADSRGRAYSTRIERSAGLTVSATETVEHVEVIGLAPAQAGVEVP
jgi:L-ascorbate metabolism protein UlaG (beta-lactamase superfamily)